MLHVAASMVSDGGSSFINHRRKGGGIKIYKNKHANMQLIVGSLVKGLLERFTLPLLSPPSLPLSLLSLSLSLTLSPLLSPPLSPSFSLSHLIFSEDSMLCEVVVQVSTVHEVQDEAKLVPRLEGIVEIDNERTVVDFGQHVLLIQSKSFSLFQFDTLLV